MIEAADIDGLTLIEQAFDERLSDALIRRVAETPSSQIPSIAERFVDSLPDSAFWREEDGPPVEVPVSTLAGESLLLDHSTLASARHDLELHLLLSPTVILSDPIHAWANSYAPAASDRCTNSGGARELARILTGLLPMRAALRDGSVRLVRPPVPTSIETNRLWVNPTTHARLPMAFPGWGTERDHNGRPNPSSYSAGRLRVDLNYLMAERDVWRDMARSVFPAVDDDQAVANLRRSIELDDYAAIHGCMAVPTAQIYSFFDSVLGSTGPAIVTLPRLQLSVQDALAVRAGEQSFAAMRHGMTELMATVGQAAADEPVEDFARRVQASAADVLGPTEDELRRLVDRGKLIGVIPGAIAMIVGLGTKLAHIPAPGAGPVSRAGASKLLKRAVAEKDAANIALRYTTNLRFAGRL